MEVALPLGRASIDDLATPLHEVTFVVVDLETTGGAPAGCGITEVGAVKLRGGECQGTFQTLVNPGEPIPPFVSALTGISEAMVTPAPSVAEVLPSLLEFLGGAVLVGHNVRYDLAFLRAALAAHGYPGWLAHRRVDTLAMARRLVRDEVADLRLGTLARHLRVPTTPTHRALDDARATGEVLHALLERAGTLGVLALDDLLELPAMRAHPTSGKLKLTARLPRVHGVYLLRDRVGRVLYVGRAANLRARVRRHFAADGRRTVPQLVRETTAIEHVVCTHPLEAIVRRLRLIREHEPRWNPEWRAWRRYAYVALGRGERSRLAPMPSRASAKLVRDAIMTAVADRTMVGSVVARALDGDPGLLTQPVEDHLAALVAAERFERAAQTRDRLAALRRALARQRLLDASLASGTVRADGLEVAGGRLVLAEDTPRMTDAGTAVPREEVDELMAVARWLARHPSPTASATPAAATLT
ncbi:MAG: exonuclease domain-containing protein [Acidimicrobiia bacterium]